MHNKRTPVEKMLDTLTAQDAELAALRAELAEVLSAAAALRVAGEAAREELGAEIERLRAELAAAHGLAQHQAKELHDALGDFAEVSGGFMQTAAYHIRAMRRGVAQLVVEHAITMSRGAEIMGLSIHQMRQWANSGLMERDANSAAEAATQSKGGAA